MTRRHEPWFWLPVLVTPVAISAPAYAVSYLTVEQAQHEFFPESSGFSKVDIVLTPDQKRAIEKASGARVRVPALSAWRVTTGGAPAGWFLVDEVLGKHEFITYAVSLDASGAYGPTSWLLGELGAETFIDTCIMHSFGDACEKLERNTLSRRASQ